MEDKLDIANMADEELRKLLITLDYKGKVVKAEALAELEARAEKRGAKRIANRVKESGE